MDNHNSCKRTDEYIDDALTTLRTIRNVIENMMEEHCESIFIHIMVQAARMVLKEICPQEVARRYPHLQEDEHFNAFLEFITSYGSGGNKNDRH